MKCNVELLCRILVYKFCNFVVVVQCTMYMYIFVLLCTIVTLHGECTKCTKPDSDREKCKDIFCLCILQFYLFMNIDDEFVQFIKKI
jgi:hypothetical protein